LDVTTWERKSRLKSWRAVRWEIAKAMRRSSSLAVNELILSYESERP